MLAGEFMYVYHVNWLCQLLFLVFHCNTFWDLVVNMFAEQIWILTRCYLIFLYNTTTTNIAAAAVQKLSVIIFFQKRHYCSGKQSKNICIW